MSIYKKLHRIQQSVVGLGKDKDSHNFKYVTGGKVLFHIKPLMNELGLLLKQEIVEISNVRQDYQVWDKWEKIFKNKSEILTTIKIKFTWIDVETGETDENMFASNGQNDWEKGFGSALTYAERYFLLKYFHIATDEDDIDNPDRKEQEEAQPIQPQNKPLPALSEKAYEKAIDRIIKGEFDLYDKLKATYTLTSAQELEINDILTSQFQEEEVEQQTQEENE